MLTNLASSRPCWGPVSICRAASSTVLGVVVPHLVELPRRVEHRRRVARASLPTSACRDDFSILSVVGQVVATGTRHVALCRQPLVLEQRPPQGGLRLDAAHLCGRRIETEQRHNTVAIDDVACGRRSRRTPIWVSRPWAADPPLDEAASPPQDHAKVQTRRETDSIEIWRIMMRF